MENGDSRDGEGSESPCCNYYGIATNKHLLSSHLLWVKNWDGYVISCYCLGLKMFSQSIYYPGQGKSKFTVVLLKNNARINK